MADKKIIAVTGATGAQGGGLAHAILDEPSGEFAVRAITRDPGKDAARALADRGAEVVQADLDDEASLRSAFDGAYGAYCLTNFWEHFSGERETAQGGNLARAAAAAGVQHAIWSTFEDTRKSIPLDDDRMPTLQEKYKVVHFDAKADANHFFTDAGVPTTFLLTSFYWENFIFFGLGPKRGKDGVLAVTYPMGDKKLPSIAVGHRQVRLRDLQAWRRAGRSDRRNRGRAPDRRGDRRRPHAGTRRGGALQRCATRRLPELRLPRRRRHREHVPVLGRLQRPLLRQPQRRVLALAESRAADARPVDGGEQGPHPARGSGLVRHV
ncbi:MAG TPA: NmrA family NAD(P)-binding protein [Vicinamibacterales bacterium]|nr:NmrA family NAD(P)-binding protein [Vicinamibacterales bacterium]